MFIQGKWPIHPTTLGKPSTQHFKTFVFRVPGIWAGRIFKQRHYLSPSIFIPLSKQNEPIQIIMVAGPDRIEGTPC